MEISRRVHADKVKSGATRVLWRPPLSACRSTRQTGTTSPGPDLRGEQGEQVQQSSESTASPQPKPNPRDRQISTAAATAAAAAPNVSTMSTDIPGAHWSCYTPSDQLQHSDCTNRRLSVHFER
nr:unnamed protein product [Spirometra erinaceieuropaei]